MITIPESIKNKIKSDSAQYNIRIHFPNGERQDICNDMIVNGTTRFTESLCSQNTLKFGLCESPVFECELVGCGNITGCTIELTYEVICDAATNGAVFKTDLQKYVFAIKKGLFLVASAERQADLQHRKIVAYGGGAATNWEIPLLEKAKADLVSSAYNCDLGKLIISKFACSNYYEMWGFVDESSLLKTYTFRTANYLVEININTLSLAELQNQNCLLELIVNTQNRISAWNSFEMLLKDYLGDKLDNALITNVNSTIKPFLNSDLVRLKKGTTFKDVYVPIDNFHSRIYPYMNELADVQYHSLSSIGYRMSVSGKQIISGTIDINNVILVNQYATGDIDFTSKYTVTKANKEDFKKLDLQKAATNVVELKGKIARVTADNDIILIDINKQYDLIPSEDLQPDEDLKPLGVTGGSISKNMYSSLWYEEAYTKPWGKVSCEYTNKSSTKTEHIIYLNGFDNDSDMNEYQTYSITDNEIIKGNTYSQSEIEAVMEEIAEAIENVSYVPVKLNCLSVPFVECGDTLEVLTQNNDSITTIVLNRTMIGESFVTDEITSV